MRRIGWVTGIAAIIALPASAWAQAGVTPLLTGPTPVAAGAMNIGGYVTVEDQFDFFGVFRYGLQTGLDLGVRAGYTDAGGGGLHLGGDLRYGLSRGSENFPLALGLVGGLQLSLLDRGNLIAIPFGVSLGKDVGTPQLPVLLYGAPHLRVMYFNPDIGPNDTRLELSVEMGSQLQVTPRLSVDAALTLASDDNDNVAFAVGLRWR